MPASENSSMASAKAMAGLVRDSPARSSMVSTVVLPRRIASMQAKAPSVMAR
jgi:hypothetical protein